MFYKYVLDKLKLDFVKILFLMLFRWFCSIHCVIATWGYIGPGVMNCRESPATLSSHYNKIKFASKNNLVCNTISKSDDLPMSAPRSLLRGSFTISRMYEAAVYLFYTIFRLNVALYYIFLEESNVNLC